jgi:outer membrane receptor protein involved in Fe transport
MKPKTPIVALFGWFAFALPSEHAAQTVTAKDTARDSNVVEMSPFIVPTDQDVGYLAANTLAGSRLNTPLKDTAASISVLTSEFLSDIGAFDISEAMHYSVNVEYQVDDDRATTPNGNESVANYQLYRIRGLSASLAQNYFNWRIPTETALVDRIEDSRGPNSVLFGIASPGGLINAMSKQALTGRSFRNASMSAGSYDSWRATLDLNQAARNGKFALRLNTVYNQTNSFRHWQYQEHQRAHLAGKYIISDRTRVRAEFERGQINSNAPRLDNLFNFFLVWNNTGRTTLPTQVSSGSLGISRMSTTVPRVTYVSNNAMTMAMRGMMATNAPSTGPYGTGTLNETSLTGDITDPSINIGGPAQDRFQRFSTFSTFVEHRVSKNSFLEVAFNHQDIKFDRSNPSTDTPQRLRGDPNQRLNDGSINPYAGQVYLEGGWSRTVSHEQSDTGRVTFSTELEAKKWGNYRVGALAEYEKNFTGSIGWEEFWVDAATGKPAFNPTPENEQNVTYRRSYPVERDWGTYFIEGPGRNGGGLLSKVYDRVTGRTLSSEWVTVAASTPREVYSSRKAGMIVGQARYFDGRLILAGGLRRDELREYSQGRMRDPVTNKWTYARNPADAAPSAPAVWTHHIGRNSSLGAVYHPLSWLSLYYNRADNITLPANQDRLPDVGSPGNPLPVAPPKGKGEDFGFALNLFENKVHARATYYTTTGARQSTTSPSAVRSANVRIMQALFDHRLIGQDELTFRTNLGGHGLFDHSSEGLELQTTVNASKNWRLQANYAIIDAVEENLFREWVAWHGKNVAYLSKFNTAGIVTSAGRTIPEEVDFYLLNLADFTENDGGTKMGSRRHKVSLFNRYTFSSGWLNGAYVGGGYRYQSKMFTGKDPRDGSAIMAPSFWNADLMAGYTVRGLGKGRRLSFQVNVFNLFDEREPLITRYQFIGSERFVFRTVPQAPRTWRFTTNFDF